MALLYNNLTLDMNVVLTHTTGHECVPLGAFGDHAYGAFALERDKLTTDTTGDCPSETIRSYSSYVLGGLPWEFAAASAC